MMLMSLLHYLQLFVNLMMKEGGFELMMLMSLLYYLQLFVNLIMKEGGFNTGNFADAR